MWSQDSRAGLQELAFGESGLQEGEGGVAGICHEEPTRCKKQGARRRPSLLLAASTRRLHSRLRLLSRLPCSSCSPHSYYPAASARVAAQCSTLYTAALHRAPWLPLHTNVWLRLLYKVASTHLLKKRGCYFKVIKTLSPYVDKVP